MSNRRPPLELIIARKWEIKRRYAKKQGKISKRGRSMAAIRLSELTRWLNDAYGDGVQLKPSEQSIAISRIFAHHMGGLPDASRRISTWLSFYAPWIDMASQERLIAEVVSCPLKWSADKLGWKIRLSDAKRTELKIKTIGAWNFSKEQRKARDKERRAERERNRRKIKRQARVPYI